MSGFAFSHQFSHRWLATPPPVKQTIIQELDDIVTLLQPETDLESYRFSVPNLHDKVEQLMAIEAIRQEKLLAEERKREREEQERLEQQRIAQEKLEQERLVQERLEQQKINQQALDQARLAAAEENKKIEQNKENTSKKNAKKKVTFTPTIENSNKIATAPLDVGECAAECLDKQAMSEPTVEHDGSQLVYAISDITTPDDEVIASGQLSEILVKSPAKVTTKANELEAIKQQIISELQGQIEKFLQESLSFMQDDVNKWLTEEVSRQLEQQLKSHVV